MRLLLTRPAQQSLRFAQKIPNDFDVAISPVLQIEYNETPLDMRGIDALMFTSENGVNAFATQQDGAGLRAYCVGDRTAAAAGVLGFDAISAGGKLDDLIRLISGQSKSQRLLHVRGAHVTGELTLQLSQDGVKIRQQVLYDQIALALSSKAKMWLSEDQPVLLPLFSPRSADLVAQQFDAGMCGRHVGICLSAAVEAALPSGVFGTVHVCERPDGNAMLDAIVAASPS